MAAFVLQAGWAVRLWRLGLARRYPSLLTFLGFATASSLVGYFLFADPQIRLSLGLRDMSPQVYSWFFITTQPIVWTLYVCVLLEVYDRVVAGYRGLQRLSQLAMYGIAGGAGVFVLATVVLDSSGNLPVSRSIAVWIRSERGISLGLTVFSLALVAFVAYFRLGVPNNVRIVFAVFGLLFAAQATLYTFHTQLGLTFREVRNSISFLIYIPCWLAGTLAFSKMGEIVPAAARIRGRLDEQHEAMLTAKLKSFNETLLRVLKS